MYSISIICDNKIRQFDGVYGAFSAFSVLVCSSKIIIQIRLCLSYRSCTRRLSVDAATSHALNGCDLQLSVEPEARSSVGAVLKIPRRDTGCRGPRFDSRLVMDWSLWQMLRARIGNKRYCGEVVPRPFLAGIPAIGHLPSVGYSQSMHIQCQQLAYSLQW